MLMMLLLMFSLLHPSIFLAFKMCSFFNEPSVAKESSLGFWFASWAGKWPALDDVEKLHRTWQFTAFPMVGTTTFGAGWHEVTLWVGHSMALKNFYWRIHEDPFSNQPLPQDICLNSVWPCNLESGMKLGITSATCATHLKQTCPIFEDFHEHVSKEAIWTLFSCQEVLAKKYQWYI